MTTPHKMPYNGMENSESWDNQNDEPFIICAVVGSGEAGKTCLIDRFTSGVFAEDVYQPKSQAQHVHSFTVDGQRIHMKTRDVQGGSYCLSCLIHPLLVLTQSTKCLKRMLILNQGDL